MGHGDPRVVFGATVTLSRPQRIVNLGPARRDEMEGGQCRNPLTHELAVEAKKAGAVDADPSSYDSS